MMIDMMLQYIDQISLHRTERDFIGKTVIPPRRIT
jgi:hypothetical protein